MRTSDNPWSYPENLARATASKYELVAFAIYQPESYIQYNDIQPIA